MEGPNPRNKSELKRLIKQSKRFIEGVKGKVEKLNSVVDAVQGVGYSVQNLNTSVDRVTNSITTNISENEEQIAQVVQWSNVAMEIADKWQQRQQRSGAVKGRY